jgi:serine protease Do
VHRSDIGVYAQTITPALASGLDLPQDWGVLLADVAPGGPGEAAGLKAGDIVLSLNGKPMENARQLPVNLYRFSAGQLITLEILSDGRKWNAPVAVVNREDDPMRFADLVDPAKNIVPKLGILGIAVDKQVVELLEELRKPYGVVIAARAGGSPYTGDALQLGDVIYTVNRTPVTSIEALNKAIDDLKEGDPLILQIQRNDRMLFLTLLIE